MKRWVWTRAWKTEKQRWHAFSTELSTSSVVGYEVARCGATFTVDELHAVWQAEPPADACRSCKLLLCTDILKG